MSVASQPTDALTGQPASVLLTLLSERQVSSVELVEASLARIEDANPTLNAFVSLDPDGALRAARAADNARLAGRAGALQGLPIGVKDLTDVAGFATTQGSRLYAHAVARTDEESIRRLKAQGAVIVGKTNTPELGFGAVCTNRLFGPTRNPWDIALTSGGSSGGSAVAVASGMVPLAQGSDFGGSVRTPASFVGCVGLRPTPGRIPEPGRPFAWDALATQGALARSVADADLLVRAMSGEHPLDPLSARPARDPTAPYQDARTLRVAASLTLGDEYRVDDAVRTAFERAVAQAAEVFGSMTAREPDVRGGFQAFQVLRAGLSWTKYGALVADHRDALTDSFVWNVERGKSLSAQDLLEAERMRTRVFKTFRRFFEDVDVLLLPAASVLPFPIDQGEVHSIGGRPTDSIIDYLACTYLVSLVGFPCLSLPVPELSNGVPFGLQLVVAPDREDLLLQAASALEAAGFRHQWAPA